MAEARAAVNIVSANRREVVVDTVARGLRFHRTEDGVVVSVTIPHLRGIRAAVVRTVFRAYRSVHNKIFPARAEVAALFVGAVMYVVVTADPDSWWRTGWLAWGLWKLDSYLPWTSSLPLLARVGYLAAAAACAGFAVFMALERMLLRALLSRQGFLFGSKGVAVKIQMGLVKLLTGNSKALTYSYQGTLPRMPVPPLKDTCRRYLESVEPLLEPEELEKTRQLVADFLKNEGPKLQRYAVLKSWASANYVSDWWETYVYLRGRSSLMINSNYYVMDSEIHNGSRHQCARAATLVHQMMLFKRKLEREQLEPLRMNNTVPTCMAQYERMFSTTRIPHKECDYNRHWSPAESRHIAVLRRGHWFKVYIHTKANHLISAFDLERQLEKVVEYADALPAPRNNAEHIPALTTENRTVWAEARSEYFSEGVNRSSLKNIERAIMVLVLDTDTIDDVNERAQALLHGNGSNRWFDKSITMVIFADGRWGLNAEHSWADAPVVAHMLEVSFLTEALLGPDALDSEGRNVAPADWVEPGNSLSPPEHLKWDLSPEAGEAVASALRNAHKMIADVQQRVVRWDGFGKGFMKKCGISPDAFLQMALQLAYLRNMGELALTYEAAATRLFRNGRTETVRPVNADSAAFVRSVDDESVTPEERLALFRTAGKRHVDTFRKAMASKGIDRHMFALYCVSMGLEIDSPFLKQALSAEWRLSTSQQPQQQTNLRAAIAAKGEDPAIHLSPGGGFGSVSDEGYGVSYMVAGEDRLYFHVSSKHSCDRTDSDAMVGCIQQALVDLRRLFEPEYSPSIPSGTSSSSSGSSSSSSSSRPADTPRRRSTRLKR